MKKTLITLAAVSAFALSSAVFAALPGERDERDLGKTHSANSGLRGNNAEPADAKRATTAKKVTTVNKTKTMKGSRHGNTTVVHHSSGHKKKAERSREVPDRGRD